jgi:hypothetical protein
LKKIQFTQCFNKEGAVFDVLLMKFNTDRILSVCSWNVSNLLQSRINIINDSSEFEEVQKIEIFECSKKEMQKR